MRLTSVHTLLTSNIICAYLVFILGWCFIKRWYHPSDRAQTKPCRRKSISLALERISLHVAGESLSCIQVTHSKRCFSPRLVKTVITPRRTGVTAQCSAGSCYTCRECATEHVSGGYNDCRRAVAHPLNGVFDSCIGVFSAVHHLVFAMYVAQRQ